MFSLDDRTGNIVTTVALFAVAAVVFYRAGGAFLILLLSLLFAYLLEPAVTLVQRHTRLGRKSRPWAIAQVYLMGALVVGGLGYALGPLLVTELKSLYAAVSGFLSGQPGGGSADALVSGHGLSVSRQLWIRDWLASHRDLVSRVVEGGASSLGYVAGNAVWLFAVPVLAIFFLLDGRETARAIAATLEPRSEPTLVTRILRRVDAMLGKYMRAQSALAGLSFVFYSISMLVLGFPYAIALGFVGGILEFLPGVGWIISAAAMLPIGFMAHAHWIWMAVLLIVWRMVQGYINSPRIMGNTLELRPLTVVFALMVGSQVGGIAGIYLSIPAVAVLRIVWLEYFSTRNSPAARSDLPVMQEKR